MRSSIFDTKLLSVPLASAVGHLSSALPLPVRFEASVDDRKTVRNCLAPIVLTQPDGGTVSKVVRSSAPKV